MIDVLLVRIQPTDRRFDDFEYFDEETVDFKIPVLNGDPLHFKFSKEYYFCPNVRRERKSIFDEKAQKIDEEFGANYQGHVVAIDKYPYYLFEKGVKICEKQNSIISRYVIECQSEDFDYNVVVLLIPGREPTVLSNLTIAFSDKHGFCSSFIVFEKKTVLSVKSPFGEVVGIPLEHCSNERALQPNHPDLRYAMSFEKVSLPAVVLQKLLETKPQAESEPHGETHG